MKLALFTDATSHPHFRKAAVGAACFDVTDPTAPTELFRLSGSIEFCECSLAEHIAVMKGLESVLARVRIGEFRAGDLLLFTDSTAVLHSVRRSRVGKDVPSRLQSVAMSIGGVVTCLELLGCPVGFRHVPRCLNRAAHRAAHDALYPPNPFMLLRPHIPAQHAQLVSRYPFLPHINA